MELKVNNTVPTHSLIPIPIPFAATKENSPLMGSNLKWTRLWVRDHLPRLVGVTFYIWWKQHQKNLYCTKGFLFNMWEVQTGSSTHLSGCTFSGLLQEKKKLALQSGHYWHHQHEHRCSIHPPPSICPVAHASSLNKHSLLLPLLLLTGATGWGCRVPEAGGGGRKGGGFHIPAWPVIVPVGLASLH